MHKKRGKPRNTRNTRKKTEKKKREQAGKASEPDAPLSLFSVSVSSTLFHPLCSSVFFPCFPCIPWLLVLHPGPRGDTISGARNQGKAASRRAALGRISRSRSAK